MKRTGTTNKKMEQLINELKKLSHTEKSGLWKRIAVELEKPTRQRRIVNLSRINRHTKENETIVVPGKVLGAGVLGHSLTVAAYAFSDTAKQQIEKANGKALSIKELVTQNPGGKDIKIIG